MSMQVQKLGLKAKLFRGLGDPTRLSILESLRQGERSASQIVAETRQSQPNVSSHLACLLECGLVKNRRVGRNVIYALSDKKVARLLDEGDFLLSKVARGIYECVNYNDNFGRKGEE
jgi:DNA-binding transcriptional ArsR family regulator